MGRVPGLVLAAWCCVAAVACGGSGHDSPAAGGSTTIVNSSGGAGSSGTGGGGATSMAGATSGGDCLIGTSCECSSGLIGLTTCVDDVEVCDCSPCPNAPVDSVPAFVACGGEPFGMWGAAEADLTAAKQSFISASGASEVWCPRADSQVESLVFMLRLDDGGTGANYFGLSSTFTVLDSCIEPAGSCTGFPGCVRGACGTCECQSLPDVIDADELTWVRSDSVLTVTIGASQLTAEYCVQGDTLTLKTTDGSDIVYTLKRGYPHGTPVACNMRTLDECASTGCHVGVCTGGGTCAEGMDETSCTNRAGCTWDPTQCAGTLLDCELGNYGSTPGCEFTLSAVCSGTPEPCDTKLDITACDATPGCFWGASVGCNGTAGECAEVPLDTCESVAGCAITPG